MLNQCSTNAQPMLNQCSTNAFHWEKFSAILMLETQLIHKSQVPDEWI
jgi:hypothetical protein